MSEEKPILTLKRKPEQQPLIASGSTVNASGKAIKVSITLDPHSINLIESEGKKQVKMLIQVGDMKLKTMLNSKTYRKAIAHISELGADNCIAVLQGNMPKFGELDGVGLIVQPRKPKEVQQPEENH